jgi:hypothetical protein
MIATILLECAKWSGVLFVNRVAQAEGREASKNFSPARVEIPEEDYPIIVDLLEQAIALGFFREYYDKSK